MKAGLLGRALSIGTKSLAAVTLGAYTTLLYVTGLLNSFLISLQFIIFKYKTLSAKKEQERTIQISMNIYIKS